MKKIITVLLIFIMCATNIVFAGFTDTNNHWGRKYIEDAVSKGLAGGYPDGKFLPDAPTTRIEAAIFAANMYKDETITSVYNTSKTKWESKLRANKIPNWADKYMVFGLEKGIFPETFLKHFVNQSTGAQNYCLRYEFITFMVNSLGFKDEFVENPVLKFDDNAKIDKQVAPYVEVMVRKGIINGTGNFNPNDKLTRAQVCVILSNSYKYSEKASSESGNQTENYIKGTIISMTMSNGNATIQIKKEDNSVGIYTASSSSTQVKKGNDNVNLSDLRIGHEIEFIAKNSQLTKINIISDSVPSYKQAEGSFISYSNNQLIMLVNDKAVTYQADSSLKFTKADRNIPITEIRVGEVLIVDLEGQKVVSGIVKPTNKTINGTIISINGDEIMINENGEITGYYIADDIVLTIDGRSDIDIAYLTYGDTIKAEVEDSVINRIEGTTKKKQVNSLAITGINQTNDKSVYTFNDKEGRVITLEANNSTVVKVDGKTESLSKLSLGMNCDVVMEAGKILEIYTDGSLQTIKVTGIVKSINLNDDTMVVDASGKKYTVEVDKNTVINNFNSSVQKSLKNIFEGDNVIIEGENSVNSIKASKIIYWV